MICYHEKNMNPKIVALLNDKCHMQFDDNQSEMARHLKMVQGTLSKILRGEVTNPSREHATKLAKFAGVTVDTIYEEGDNSTPFDSTLSPDETQLLSLYRDIKRAAPHVAGTVHSYLSGLLAAVERESPGKTKRE